MIWITMLWPTITGACITMGLISFTIGLQKQNKRSYLLFSTIAFCFAIFSLLELARLNTQSTAQFLELQRWMDIVGSVGVIALAGFVATSFKTGRKSLLYFGSALLLISQIFNLFPEPKLVFLQITALKTVQTFGGASYIIAEGVRNPWVALFYLGILVIIGFVSSASISALRKGQNRRTVIVGGTTIFFLLFGGLHTLLVDSEVLAIPYFVSFYFLMTLVAMGTELTIDVLRASQLAQDLTESEKQISLAAAAAQFGLWVWTKKTNDVWATPRALELLGFSVTQALDKARFVSAVYVGELNDKRADVYFSQVSDDGANYERELKVQSTNGQSRWVTIRGQIERDSARHVEKVRGVILDISRLKDAEAIIQSMSGRLIQAMEDERKRVARELHDDLSQSLTLLAIQVDLASKQGSFDKDVTAEQLHRFSSQIKHLVSTVYRISHQLHPANLEQLRLEAALRSYCEELSATREVDIELEIPATLEQLSDDISLCVYRIVQEALHNIVKHGKTKRASVVLTTNKQALILQVSDQGCGFDISAAAYGASLGLASMYERARLVGGKLSVHSRDGEGTQISLRIPLMHTQ